MKWPIESIYEVTKKKLENCHLTIFFIRILWIASNGFFDFCGIFRLSKMCKKKVVLSYIVANWKLDGRCKTPPTLFPKIQEKKKIVLSCWLCMFWALIFSQEKYLYVVKGAEIMQIGDAHWKSTCWVDFRKRVEKSLVADGFKKLFESWILKANNQSLG